METVIISGEVDKVDDFDINKAAQAASLQLYPEKSKIRYEAMYKAFKQWCEVKKVRSIEENVLLAYFLERSQKLKSPSSLWCEYSMLRTTISINDNEDISKYLRLHAFLKRKNDGYQPKKSNVFTREEINHFLTDAPDEIYLLTKVVMVLAVAGACRVDEFVNLLNEDIEEKPNFVLVNIRKTKNKVSRSFIITNSTANVGFVDIFKKYVAVKKKNANVAKQSRFFMRYEKGKCQNQPVGKNTFYKIPYVIAKFLNLSNPNLYSGHAFRRTSATLLANSGVDTLNLKKHGGWKSSAIAESYVGDSICQKLNIDNKILSNDCQSVPSPSTAPSTSFSEMQVDTLLVNKDTDISQLNNMSKNVEISEDIANNRFISINNCRDCTFTINVNKLN